MFLVSSLSFLTLIEEVTTVDQREGWYRELRHNQFSRMVLIRQVFENSEQKGVCPELIAQNELKLNKEKLKLIRDTGLKFFLVPAKNFGGSWFQCLFIILF